MTIKKAKQLKIGDIVNGYDSVTCVVICGSNIRVYTLCYIHNFNAEDDIECGSKFHAWYPGEPDAASEFNAETWVEAKSKAIEYLECREHGYVGEIVLQNAFNGERKTFNA